MAISAQSYKTVTLRVLKLTQKVFGTQVHLLFAKRLFFLFSTPLKVSKPILPTL